MDENQVVAEIYPANMDLVRRAIQTCREQGATESDCKLLGELLAIGAQQVVNMARAAGSVLGSVH